MHAVIYLVVVLVVLMGLGKWWSVQQAADQRRELTALRRELDDLKAALKATLLKDQG